VHIEITPLPSEEELRYYRVNKWLFRGLGAGAIVGLLSTAYNQVKQGDVRPIMMLTDTLELLAVGITFVGERQNVAALNQAQTILDENEAIMSGQQRPHPVE